MSAGRAFLIGLAGLCLAGGAPLAAKPAAAPRDALASDIPSDFKLDERSYDYVKRDVMIPMRDGVKLHTVIVIPKAGGKRPILLDRTPYDAGKMLGKVNSPHFADILPRDFAEFAAAGYIIVAQDVRGKYGSEGVYVNERPLRGPLNLGPIDHATDAWDTIDWLVKQVPESNGKVGMIGVSYDGMMVLMALSDPHPALKAAVPINPVADTWMNDDDFHGGAFRLVGYDYYFEQDSVKGDGGALPRAGVDDYDVFLKAGSAWNFATAQGIDKLPFPARMAQHPAYDDFWKAQALERILPRKPPSTPTLYVASQWDQEDSFGAIAVYEAMRAGDPEHRRDRLVMGPWNHGGAEDDGSKLGALSFGEDTAARFRREMLLPFLDANLKDNAPAANAAPVRVYQTGANQWRSFTTWPESCAEGCPERSRPLYLKPGGGLGFEAPGGAEHAVDYVSDPAKPVPYRARPIRPTYADDSTWGRWLVDDQREFSSRPDVISWTSEVLTEPVAIAGAPVAHLKAATTGGDVDWVVKLIDVYPDDVATEPAMGGYQLMIAADILRARYREDFSAPRPVTPGKAERYAVALPNAAHVFLPGHRIMVQVQSTWFPLYDRNPQTFVDNIFFAKPADYRPATQSVFDAGADSSYIDLPVVASP